MAVARPRKPCPTILSSMSKMIVKFAEAAAGMPFSDPRNWSEFPFLVWTRNTKKSNFSRVL